MMIRASILMLGILSFMSQVANAADVRHTQFPDGLWGAWALSQELCASADRSNVSIAAAQFTSSDGKCDVLWITERSAARGPTYGAHARCADPNQPDRAQARDLIFWPQDKNTIQIGKSFNELKTYQRCPIK